MGDLWSKCDIYSKCHELRYLITSPYCCTFVAVITCSSHRLGTNVLRALRNGVKARAAAAHARRPSRSLAVRNESAWIGAVLRMSTSWIVTLALLLQIALSAMPAASAASIDVLASAGICHSIDTSAPAESQDRVVVHFKCIACVLVCSLPPPSLVVTAAPNQVDSLRTASDRLGRRACAAAALAFTPFRNALSTFVPSLCEEQVITATKVQQYGEVIRYRNS